MSVLTIAGLTQFYGGSQTLWGVDLAVPAGSRVCLLGRNGMGKSTLLKCVMGLLPSTDGEIRFGDTDLRAKRAHDRARLGIGYVPQGREIFPRLTVEENLRIGLGVRAGGGRSIPDRIFDLFPVLAQMRRPRAGPRPDAAHPRRADRGDSAESRPRDRRRHPGAQSRDGRHGAPGRAAAAVRAPGRERIWRAREGPLRRAWAD